MSATLVHASGPAGVWSCTMLVGFLDCSSKFEGCYTILESSHWRKCGVLRIEKPVLVACDDSPDSSV